MWQIALWLPQIAPKFYKVTSFHPASSSFVFVPPIAFPFVAITTLEQNCLLTAIAPSPLRFSFCVIFLYPSKSQGRQDLKVRSFFAIFIIETRKTIHCSTLEQSFKIQRACNAQVHPSISPYLSNLHFSRLQICLCVQSSTSLRKYSCMDATFCLLVPHTSSKGTFLFACLIIHCVWVAWKLQGLKFF